MLVKKSPKPGKAKADDRIWWSKWWAVVIWSLLSLGAVLPAFLGWLVYALLPVDNTVAGTDLAVAPKQPSIWVERGALIAALFVLVMPIFTARWARKQWLGWLLVALVLNIVILWIGLSIFSIV